MDGNLAQQILDEVLPYLEALDTQSGAILQLLKDKGLTTDEQFAPYLDRAGNMANVKWLAARVRISHLLSGLEKKTEQERKSEEEKAEEGKKKESDTAAQQARALEDPAETQSAKADATADDSPQNNPERTSENKSKTKEHPEIEAKAREEKADQKVVAKKADTKDETVK